MWNQTCWEKKKRIIQLIFSPLVIPLKDEGETLTVQTCRLLLLAAVNSLIHKNLSIKSINHFLDQGLCC